MSDLLIPPLAVDDRSRAIDALAARMTGLDLTPILVYLIDLVPADALPLLAEQFNVVGPLWRYLPNDDARRRAIKESVEWHRAKGTPWSISTALAWAGHLVRVEDLSGSANRWTEYQLEFQHPVKMAALPEVVDLSRFAAPARAHLVRLYHGWDKRRLIASSERSRISQGLLSEDSGVVIDGLKVSFGSTQSGSLTANPITVVGGAEALVTGHLIISRWPRVGHYRLSRPWPWRASGSTGALMTGGNVMPAGMLSAHSRPRRIVRAALVAGKPLPLGTLNSRLSGMPPLTWPTIPWVMSQTVLSGQSQVWARGERYEVFSDRRMGAVDTPLLLDISTRQNTILTGSAARRPAAQQHRWAGGWDERCWQRPTAGSGHTFVEELSP